MKCAGLQDQWARDNAEGTSRVDVTDMPVGAAACTASSYCAPDRNRTCDQEIRRLLLYPLSYRGWRLQPGPRTVARLGSNPPFTLSSHRVYAGPASQWHGRERARSSGRIEAPVRSAAACWCSARHDPGSACDDAHCGSAVRRQCARESRRRVCDRARRACSPGQ
jgi:hypothetical protein